MHACEGFAICAHVLEDDIAGQHGRDDGVNGLERLRQPETEFRPLGRAADCDVRVCRGLEGGQTGTDDEHGTAEAAEGALHSGRPEHQCADAVDG